MTDSGRNSRCVSMLPNEAVNSKSSVAGKDADSKPNSLGLDTNHGFTNIQDRRYASVCKYISLKMWLVVMYHRMQPGP
jgi:hypothetical protein